MLVTGAMGGFGHWLLILAHRLAPATVLAPFIYSQIVWMVTLGYLVFGQFPDRWTFIGAAIVISSGLYLLYRERVRARARGLGPARLSVGGSQPFGASDTPFCVRDPVREHRHVIFAPAIGDGRGIGVLDRIADRVRRRQPHWRRLRDSGHPSAR